MTDGDLMRTLVQRCASWTALLEQLRIEHANNLGRKPEAITWIPGDTLGRWSWYGYFWSPERFWFGYGYHRGEWTPLIEADVRNPHAQSWLQLQIQLPGAWVVDMGGCYARLWAALPPSASVETQFNWFRDRSMELHEYSLIER
ncbi:MAG: hypothetical protein JNN01_23895 [Opitutaceae bacterium]|nr:hypothetical protein [Opitutaceae bacterium]